MKEFLNMGGYGFFVWTSYIITIIIFIAHFVVTGNNLKKVKNRIKRKLRREGKI